MKVLVTGAQGYIGTVLCRYLREQGHVVTGLDIGLFRDCVLPGCKVSDDVWQKDVRDIVPAELHGFEAIVHLAALCNDPLGDMDPVLTWEINHRAAVRVAKAAIAANVKRFVLFSSCSVYGRTGNEPVTEDADVSPLTTYAVAKWAAEQSILALDGPFFSAVALRFGTVHGFSPRQRFDLLVPDLCGSAYTAGKIAMTSDGSPRRPLTHIRDVCCAVDRVLRANDQVVGGQVFNVVGENFKVRDAAEAVKQVFPEAQLSFGPKSRDARDYLVSGEKITRFLAWQPTMTVRSGAQHMRAKFDEIGLTADAYHGSIGRRLGWVGALLSSGLIGADLRWLTTKSTGSLSHR